MRAASRPSRRGCSEESTSMTSERRCLTCPGAAAANVSKPSSVRMALVRRPSVSSACRRTKPRRSRRSTTCESCDSDALVTSGSARRYVTSVAAAEGVIRLVTRHSGGAARVKAATPTRSRPPAGASWRDEGDIRRPYDAAVKPSSRWLEASMVRREVFASPGTRRVRSESGQREQSSAEHHRRGEAAPRPI
jgi:hypothetical protein